MADPFTQKLIPFGEPPETHAEATVYRPSAETIAAVARLKEWLKSPHIGRMTSFAEETVRAVEKALIEGKNGWWHQAEDGLEGLLLRNGNRQGDDIPVGVSLEGGFHQAVEDVLDCLHELLLSRAR